MKMMLLLGQSS